MQTLQKTAYEKKIIIILLLAVYLFTMMLIFVKPTLAFESINDLKPGEKAFWTLRINQIRKIYYIASFTLGGIGLAFCGIQYIGGDQQTAQKALSRAIYIVIAIIALLILPKFVSMGMQLGREHGWDPSNL